jgi:hypothetical protein
MTTSIETATEWTATALRPTARWVPVAGPGGRTRMQMTWCVPSVDMTQVAPAA